MKPNLQLASFLEELLAAYDENKHEEIISNLSQKWQIEAEDIEFYLEAIKSYNFRSILANMVVSANYDKHFMEVFRAIDYLNGKIDEEGNLKSTKRQKASFFSYLSLASNGFSLYFLYFLRYYLLG